MLKIITNHQPRDILYGFELTENQRAQFDYIDDIDNAEFVVYRGELYDLHEFMRTPQNEPARQELNELSQWDGYLSDTYFSGIVVKYTADFEQVIVGCYFV